MYVFIWVWVYVCVNVHANVCSCMQRPEADINYSSIVLTLLFETGFFNEFTTYRFNRTGWLRSSRDLPSLLPSFGITDRNHHV